MGHLILPGGNTNSYPGFSLLGESSLAITFDDALIDSVLDFLVLKGTTSVSIASNGFSAGFHVLHRRRGGDIGHYPVAEVAIGLSHRCFGDDRPRGYLCRCHKHERCWSFR